MADSDCDETEEWLWEWDDAGEWGTIIPKTRPHQAIDINGGTKKASLYTKHSGDNQKFRKYGKWLISKASHGQALTIDGEGNLGVEPIECDSDKHDFSTIKIHCDAGTDEEETQEPAYPETEPENQEEKPATLKEILAGESFSSVFQK